jgi:hypothetical protein
VIDLAQQKNKNKKLTKARKLLVNQIGDLDIQRDKVQEKLKTLKAKQKELKTLAKKKKVCLSLIKYSDISSNYLKDNDNSLVQSIENTSTSLVEVIADTQNYLGVNDLTKITTAHQMPDGKNLGDLITFYQENKDKAPTPSNPQIITKLVSGEPNETLIVNQIITGCDLGLTENSNLTQVIERINKLIKTKPPIVKPVSQPLTDTPFGESLEKIREIDLAYLTQNWHLLSSEVEALKQATNYSEFASVRNNLIEQYYKGQQLTNNSLTKPEPPLLTKGWSER